MITARKFCGSIPDRKLQVLSKVQVAEISVTLKNCFSA